MGHLKNNQLTSGIYWYLTLGRTRKVIPPPWYKGGGEEWMEPLPAVFDMLQYFETILPLVESL